jgi:hypothetical protein
MAQVVVVTGHYPGPAELRNPHFRGELAEFARGYGIGETDAADIAGNLAPDADGFSQIGTGGRGEFTLYDAALYDALVAALPERP